MNTTHKIQNTANHASDFVLLAIFIGIIAVVILSGVVLLAEGYVWGALIPAAGLVPLGYFAVRLVRDLTKRSA